MSLTYAGDQRELKGFPLLEMIRTHSNTYNNKVGNFCSRPEAQLHLFTCKHLVLDCVPAFQ